MDKPKISLSSISENLKAKDYERFKSLYDISKLLNTGLTPEILFYCMRLCEAGVNPQALSNVVKIIKQKVNDYNEDIKRGNIEEFDLSTKWIE